MQTLENNNRDLVQALKASELYRSYELAFSATTGLPLNLRPVETWHLAHHGKRHENPFCAAVASRSRTCAACLRMHQEVVDQAKEEPQTLICQNGLFETAVPIYIGKRLVGFLQTGQAFLTPPTTEGFNNVAANLAAQGLDTEREVLKKAFFDSPVFSREGHNSTVQLLNIFANHLSLVANQMVLQHSHTEPAIIRRAKDFIQEHYTEKLTLEQVAKRVNASTFYFCKIFKKVVGLNFTEYVSRVRIEKAKTLLLNRQLRISEIAFEVGFESLTHFNRIFKKILGVSPTEYRNGLHST